MVDDLRMIYLNIRPSHGSSQTTRRMTRRSTWTMSHSTSFTREEMLHLNISEIYPKICSSLVQRRGKPNSRKSTRIWTASSILTTGFTVAPITQIQASCFTILQESVHSSMHWLNCRGLTWTTLTESSIHFKSHTRMHWKIILTCEKLSLNSFTCQSYSSTTTR